MVVIPSLITLLLGNESVNEVTTVLTELVELAAKNCARLAKWEERAPGAKEISAEEEAIETQMWTYGISSALLHKKAVPKNYIKVSKWKKAYADMLTQLSLGLLSKDIAEAYLHAANDVLTKSSHAKSSSAKI